MEGKGYTQERNVQVLICLLKHHGIHRVIVSPGTTNLTFVESIQHDSFFQIFSSVDERSAAYMACGIASETQEPVALSCTEATASRNYYPGLTEAFYRKLPILAITSTRNLGNSGFGVPQHIDRSEHAADVVKMSVQIPSFTTVEDEWIYSIQMNRAILELTHHGCGPVHINLSTTYSPYYGVETLKDPAYVDRLDYHTRQLPRVPIGKTVIYMGEHQKWSEELVKQVNVFCEKYNSVVLCDQSSKCRSKYGINAALITTQDLYNYSGASMDVLIYIGNISGAYMKLNPKQVWRVNPDGELRDTFGKLRYVFEMDEEEFFRKYNQIAEKNGLKIDTSCYKGWFEEDARLRVNIKDLPFSNVWIAQQVVHKLPKNSRLYLGILNSLRSWNYFEKPEEVDGFCNTGGFGIDGGMSTMIGASVSAPNELFFGVFGDLGFFYDMNVLGNREVLNNIRILLINNGKGAEFKNYFHDAAKFGDDADKFVAAAGHYGNKSPQLVRHYSEDLGYTYFSANTKDEFLEHLEDFVSPKILDKPVLFEVFTDDKHESEANYIMRHLYEDKKVATKSAAKAFIKKMLGDQGYQSVKHLLGK